MNGLIMENGFQKSKKIWRKSTILFFQRFSVIQHGYVKSRSADVQEIARVQFPHVNGDNISVQKAFQRFHRILRYPDGRRIRVHFFDTEDREVAMMQKRRMDALHRQAQRYDKKYTLLKKYGTNEDVDNVWDFFPGMRRNEDGYTLADYSDLPGLVEAYIQKQRPKNELYHLVYHYHVEGYTIRQISERLGRPEKRIYEYYEEAMRLAQEYRKLYFDEGCYKFPETFKSKRTR